LLCGAFLLCLLLRRSNSLQHSHDACASCCKRHGTNREGNGLLLSLRKKKGGQDAFSQGKVSPLPQKRRGTHEKVMTFSSPLEIRKGIRSKFLNQAVRSSVATHTEPREAGGTPGKSSLFFFTVTQYMRGSFKTAVSYVRAVHVCSCASRQNYRCSIIGAERFCCSFFSFFSIASRLWGREREMSGRRAARVDMCVRFTVRARIGAGEQRLCDRLGVPEIRLSGEGER